MRAAMGDEHRIARRQFEKVAILAAQGHVAGRDKVEIGVAVLGAKAHAEGRAGLDAAVLHAAQAHAAQQFIDQVGRQGKSIRGSHGRGFGQKLKGLHHRSS